MKHNRNVIIIAAGDGTRWNNYMNIPKHLIEIDDEPILHRTVRQVKGHGANVWVVSKQQTKKLYSKAGADIYVPTFNEEMVDGDKFYNSSELWNRDGRTIILYGDVYFSDDAMDTIMGWTQPQFRLFARAFESKITGTPYGECFAISFYEGDVDYCLSALRKIARLYKWGILPRCGGWEFYRAMIGLPDELIGRHFVGESFTNIDDWSDDFDTKEDYLRFIKRRKQSGFGV